VLKVRYIGEGMVSYEELRPWVKEQKLPKDIIATEEDMEDSP
jgi:hypothetical protein